jgi:hypothetical protein
MTGPAYRFDFDGEIPIAEAELTLHLAVFAVEGLFGQARVRLDAGYHLDEPRRAIIVDGGTEVGRALVRVFASLLLREFGEQAFTVRPSAVPGKAHAGQEAA